MSDSKVEIKIPEQMIDTIVRAELVKALGDRGELITAVVKQAVNMKADRYGDQTAFAKMVDEKIRNLADDIFGEWLEANKEKVRKALMVELSKKRRLTEFCDALIDGVSKFNCSVNLNLPKDYWE